VGNLPKGAVHERRKTSERGLTEAPGRPRGQGATEGRGTRESGGGAHGMESHARRGGAAAQTSVRGNPATAGKLYLPLAVAGNIRSSLLHYSYRWLQHKNKA